MSGVTTSATLSTRESLIVAAERLFAERGIGEVSLREVGAAAGQRNTSAAKYHFGDKDSLVLATMEYRMDKINVERLKILAAMQSEGRSSDLRSLLEAFVRPLAASIRVPGSHYARFLAQLGTYPLYRDFRDSESAVSIRLVRTGLERCLSDLPPTVVSLRLQMLLHAVVHSLADQEHSRIVRSPADDDVWLEDLIDGVHGMLTAPVTTKH
ncbi:MAG: TetR/AcrR family transcriptional regulator [Rhodococcus sp. (in: high G+C Gram-positive bacteria)]|jgi:AcrR family transcriptional regulator|nr:MAG: TetR/AcrR family transcriptional regulator [Rhodococcus sp. (in: high G+C Gram-positive bacteria)]